MKAEMLELHVYCAVCSGASTASVPTGLGGPKVSQARETLIRRGWQRCGNKWRCANCAERKHDDTQQNHHDAD